MKWLPDLTTERQAEETGYTEGIEWTGNYLKSVNGKVDDPGLLAETGIEWHERLWPDQRSQHSRFYLEWAHGFSHGVMIRWQSQVIRLPTA